MKYINKLQVYMYLIALIILTVGMKQYIIFFQQEHDALTSKETNELLNEIKSSSRQYNEEAQDAYIDRVWKKTPGRNGRKVNIEKSYENMQEVGEFDSSLLVFDDTKPNISLKDLPAFPIYRGHPEKEMVALLINVSWGEEYIPEILKTLKKQQIKATFFIEGSWAKKNKEIVKMIHEQNHVIGNHAYNHPDMAKLSQEEMRKQIDKTNEIIEAIIDKQPVWFAPPSGSFNDQVVKIAHELGLETILWTVDTIDWKNPSVSVMINRVVNNLHPGATILMHPTDSVAQGLTPLIEEIKQKEYEMGTIENLLSEKR